jgi:hypothetical protein
MDNRGGELKPPRTDLALWRSPLRHEEREMKKRYEDLDSTPVEKLTGLYEPDGEYEGPEALLGEQHEEPHGGLRKTDDAGPYGNCDVLGSSEW